MKTPQMSQSRCLHQPCSAELRALRSRMAKARGFGKNVSAATRKANALKARSALATEEVKSKRRRTGRAKKEQHECALDWDLRAPDGTVFRIRNLASFIRENQTLFTPQQLLPVNKNGRTRIEACLSQLSPRHKDSFKRTRHGWTRALPQNDPDQIREGKTL